MRTSHRSSVQGFTLVEMLIVIVIIAILAVLIIPSLLGVSRRARETSLRANLHRLRSAVEQFHEDTGLYPSTLDQLVSQRDPVSGMDVNGTVLLVPGGLYRGPYFPRTGGIAELGIPCNPFVDQTVTEPTEHWKYLPEDGSVTVPDSVASLITMDGVWFSDL